MNNRNRDNECDKQIGNILSTLRSLKPIHSISAQEKNVWRTNNQQLKSLRNLQQQIAILHDLICRRRLMPPKFLQPNNQYIR